MGNLETVVVVAVVYAVVFAAHRAARTLESRAARALGDSQTH